MRFLIILFFMMDSALAYDACDYRIDPDYQAQSVIEKRIIKTPPEYGVADIDFSHGVDWAELNDAPRSFRWWLNTMRSIEPAIANEAAPTKEKLAGALSLFHDWIKNNPSDSPASDFAWENHAAAVRSEHLACLFQRFPDDPLLKKSVSDHAAVLSDPENYDGPWNHGLDQDIGLLALGCVTANDGWKEAAAARMIEAVGQMVDQEGASSEQAIGYHEYAYLRLSNSQRMLNSCGIKYEPTLFSGVAKMPDFLRHATRPDGTLAQIGDTHLREAIDTGLAGGKSLDTVAVYGAGYVFGRSGWDEDDSYYTLRFGPQRMIHGHNDHTSLTYFTHGQRFLIDGGFHGYTKDKWRPFFRSPQAHNVVISTDKTRFLWNAKTALTQQRAEEGWESFVLSDAPYHKTRRRRSVFISHDPEVIIVADFLTAYKKRGFAQLWRFDSGMSVSVVDDAAVISRGPFKAVMKQQWKHDGMKIIEGSEKPLQGWAGYEQYEISPAPVISTQKSGKSVGYLTVFAFDVAPGDLIIGDQPYRVDDKTRKISVTVSGRKLALTISKRGLIEPID